MMAVFVAVRAVVAPVTVIAVVAVVAVIAPDTVVAPVAVVATTVVAAIAVVAAITVVVAITVVAVAAVRRQFCGVCLGAHTGPQRKAQHGDLVTVASDTVLMFDCLLSPRDASDHRHVAACRT